MFRPLLFLTLLPSLVIGKSTQTWAHTESDLPVDEKALFGELENGFRYVLYENAEPPGRVSLRLHVDAGSLSEEEDQQGMAHFLEHMLFEGSKNYTAAELIPEMQRLGIEFGAHANAYTSFDETVYMLDLPNLEEKTLNLGFTVMRDFCDGALLQEKEIEAERGVILSEKNSRDSVDFRLLKKQFEYLLPNSLITHRFPIGIEETIKNCPPSRIRELYEDYYDPRLMTFVVVGDIDVAEYEKRIKETFGSMDSSGEPGALPEMGSIAEPTEIKAALFTDPEVDEEDVTIIRAFQNESKPDTAETRAEKLPLKIAHAIIARRFEKLAKQEGSPINSGTAYDNVWFDTVGFGSVYVTPSEGKWKEAVPVLEQEFRRALKHGFTQSEFKEITARLVKAAELAVEAAETRQSSGIAMSLIQGINDRRAFTTAETNLSTLKKTLTELSATDCHEAFKTFWDVPGYQLILTTTEDSGNDAETLLKLYKESQAVDVTAPEETEAIAFGYDTFGETGSVSSETHIEDLDFHQLTLSNGVRVNLKKTDFEKGRIYVTARMDGGLKEAPKKGLSSMAQAIFMGGGLGKHTADELKQLLAGNAVGTSFMIEEGAFSLTGVTNQEDFLLQCQLLCAFLTDPGYGAEAELLYKKALPDAYDQLNQTLEGTFQYLRGYARGGDHRFSVPTEEEATALTTEEVKAWISPYLKGAIELTVVGDMDLEAVKEDLLKSFGTLPAAPQKDAGAPEELNLPSTPAEKAFTYKSELDRAASVVSWRTVGLSDNISEMRRLNILADILTNRMREEVREKLGSSYSPFARSSSSDVFSNVGSLSAISICKTEDIGKINELVLKLGTDLSTDGATADELDRALNPVVEGLETSLRSNSYWLQTVLGRSQAEPKRLEWARNREEDYKSITLEEVNALAKTYLKKENAILYSLHPEK